MTSSDLAPSLTAALPERAVIEVSGPDWRSFLQGLITQDVETLAAGELRYSALLTPQGRLLYDLFLFGEADGVRLDAPAPFRDMLVAKLKLYRLRAKVEIAASDAPVVVAFGGTPTGAQGAAAWRRDPRLPALGWRTVGAQAATSTAAAYDAHRLALGAPDLLRDGLSDRDYALEANLDLLNGVDFRKGCFVGQETTSRMKRRTTVKSRLVPLSFDGPPPPPGTEVLAGTLRAGEVRSGIDGRALALLRLDRTAEGGLTAAGLAVRLDPPDWLQPAIAAVADSAA